MSHPKTISLVFQALTVVWQAVRVFRISRRSVKVRPTANQGIFPMLERGGGLCTTSAITEGRDIMKLKASIAVFAVAAAFGGNVAANEIQDKAAECRALIGYAAFVASYSSGTPAGTGAWLAVANEQEFTQSNIIACSIPKNKKVSFSVGTMPAAQCGLLSKLASADNKFVPSKETQALAILAAMPEQT
jgi:hypothetical protein